MNVIDSIVIQFNVFHIFVASKAVSIWSLPVMLASGPELQRSMEN